VKDLKIAVMKVEEKPEAYENKGTAGTYGVVAKIPSEFLVDDFLKEFLHQVYVSTF